MPITSRSEYGMRAMILLATPFGEERLSASELARRGHIPVKYLEQILAELKRANLVVSHAGARGGYRLARPAREVTAGDVIRVLDGSLLPAGCAGQEESGERDHEVSHNLRPLWARLQQSMDAVLDGTSLEQLSHASGFVSQLSVDSTEEDKPPASTSVYHI